MTLKDLHESWVKTGYPSRTEIRKAIEGLLAEQSQTPTEEGNKLPKGRTCRSCLHTTKCKQIGIYLPNSEVCDFDPCRYAEYQGDMTPEPMFMMEICEALGWQGGNVHEAIKEIKRLRAVEITTVEADGEKGLFKAISELANCRGRRVSTKELRVTLDKFRGGK